ncbi:hypothetical protein H2198_001027 [Neophaeococcomyces mojaviensis]|uniref:Uncharacterized protein n=1 Tax=Neophaeococcomyces mojaviensis TaxID=3383035 RepID=A0ACC3AI17_9EURO|nr:hypothetical protein H2198_001027 [Knufia sp. JES_112]
MATSNTVFLIGVGFIGGEVLDFLLEAGYNVTALVRRENHASELKALGVQPLMGSLEDKDILIEQAKIHDIVVHTATADDLPSVEAVLEGIKQRAASGRSSIYIHTSGCSELCDYSNGAFRSEVIFEDDKPKDIDALSHDAPHREVDLAILKARQELGEKAKIAIVLPPVIYGVSSRAKRLSIQLPTLTRFAIKHGFAGHVGKGLPVWSHVHVKDLARAYLTILQWLQSSASNDIYNNPYFFIENGTEFSWKECAIETGKALQAIGKISDPEPREIPESLYGDIFGPYTTHVVGANARNRANRLRKLGWSPQEKDTFASLREDEIPIILQDEGPFTGYSAAVASGK